MLSYVVTSQRATAILHSMVCNFTGESDRNLILAKGSWLEIHTISSHGIIPETEVNLYGKIASLNYFRPSNSKQDSIFVLTEKRHFCILGYESSSKKLVSIATGNMKDRNSRPIESGVRVEIDNVHKLVGMVLYEGLMKLLPVDSSTVREAFNVRLDLLKFIDFKFLSGFSKPTVAVLCDDVRRGRCIKIFEVNLQDKELSPGSWTTPIIVDHSSNRLVAVPSPMRGLIVIGSGVLSYMSVGSGVGGSSGVTQSAILPANSEICAIGQIDADGSRYLMGDQTGGLFVIVLLKSSAAANVSSIVVDLIGSVNIPQTLCYLDNGIVHVGSVFGDSQLIKLKSAVDTSAGESFVEVIENYANIGPILDMTVVQSEKQGQGHVVTCSGAFKNGSLRVIRSGIAIHEQASMDISGIKGIWSLRQSLSSAFDSYLVQSFMAETRVLAICEEELSELVIPGFDHDATSLYCGNMIAGTIVQVTASSVRVVDAMTLALLSQYNPNLTHNSRIQVATANSSQLVLAVSGGELIYLELNESTKRFEEKAKITLDQEIACMSIRPVSFVDSMVVEDISDGFSSSAGKSFCNELHPTATSSLLCLGMWTDNSVRLLAVPSLEVISTTPLGVETQARDVLLVTLGSVTYLMVGLGDGYIVTYAVDYTSGLPTLNTRKKVLLGSYPVSFGCFTNSLTGELCVFATCDRPTVIYNQANSLSYSAVNIALSEVNCMVPFHTELFPSCLTVSSEESLMIGTVDNIQKLHIDSVPLDECPRRITHIASSSIFAVCSEKTTVIEQVEGRVLFLEEGLMAQVHCHVLDPLEQAISCTTCVFVENDGSEMTSRDDKEYLVVGTAYLIPDEAEPTRGRVLVFEVVPASSSVSGKAEVCLTTEISVDGAVFSLANLNGRLVAGISSRVQVFKWSHDSGEVGESKSSNAESTTAGVKLVPECSNQGNILALYLKTHGNFVLVGDLLRSVTLLRYQSNSALNSTTSNGNGTLDEIARDFSANPMRAIEICGVSDEFFLGCDDFSNLFIVRRQLDAVTEEERGKMAPYAEFHLGDTVNVFRYGTLSSQPPDALEVTFPNGPNSLLFGTVSGSIGTILFLSKESFHFFAQLEKAVKAVTSGIGGLSHDDYRSFSNEMKTSRQRNMIDGDLVETILSMDRDVVEEVVKHFNDNYVELKAEIAAEPDACDGSTMNISVEAVSPVPKTEFAVEECIRRVDEMARRH